MSEARRRSLGGGCTRQIPGRRSCVRLSLPGSRSAENVLQSVSEPLPQMLTMSLITKATGACSAIHPTCRVCATVATAERRWQLCGKAIKNRSANSTGIVPASGARMRMCMRAGADAGIFSDLPPGSKSFQTRREHRSPTLHAKNFPQTKFQKGGVKWPAQESPQMSLLQPEPSI